MWIIRNYIFVPFFKSKDKRIPSKIQKWICACILNIDLIDSLYVTFLYVLNVIDVLNVLWVFIPRCSCVIFSQIVFNCLATVRTGCILMLWIIRPTCQLTLRAFQNWLKFKTLLQASTVRNFKSILKLLKREIVSDKSVI